MAEKQGLMSRTAGRLVLALTIALAALVLGPAAAALAAPHLTIETPEGSPTNNPTPQLRGTTDDSFDEVTVVIEAVGGGGAVTLNAVLAGEEWSVSPAAALPDGEYTAQAFQANPLEEEGEGRSGSAGFTIDTVAPTLTLAQPPALSKNTKPSFSGSSSDNTPVVVRVYNSSHTEVASATGGGGGSWTAGNENSLSDGTYTAQAEQSDQAGNPASSDTVTFTVNTSSPTVVLNQPTSPSNNTKPTFSGTASDTEPVIVEIFKAGSKVASATASGTGGGWSASNEANLTSGAYTAVATQASSLGNPSGKSNQVAFTVDTSSPTVVLNQPTSPSNNTKPTFSGTASGTETVVVEIFSAGSKVASAAASGTGGGWSASNEPSLASGAYTAVATQASSLGNPSGESTQVEFTIDTSAPAPQITAPANGAYVKTEKPTISGTAGSAPGDATAVTLTITPASGLAQKATVSRSGGTWSYTVPTALSNGTYTAQAEQTDLAGNGGASTASTITFTVKTQGPAVTLSAVPSATNNPTPVFKGAAGVATGDIKSVTVKISGAATQTLSATVSGTEWSVAAAHLADGAYAVRAEQSDEAGNTATSSSAKFTVDTVAPLVSLTPGSKEKHTPSPIFEGSAGAVPGDLPTVTLKIYSGASASGSPVRVTSVVSKSAKWSVETPAPLPNGTYTAQAEQADEAGNRGLSTPPSTFTISSNGPAVTLTPVAPETNNPTPTFSGSAGIPNGEVRLQVYVGTHAEGTVARELTVKATGSTWSAGPVALLPDATYTAIAEECGSGPIAKCPHEQLGISQTEATFTVDTVSPVVSLASPGNGSSASGGSQLVEGTAGTAPGDAATITVRLAAGPSIGGQISQTRVVANEGGRWHVSFEGLAPGTYTAQAEQSDAAGNSSLSQAVTFTLTPAPVSSAAPTAAFTWVPSAPRVGQVVSLVSSSLAATSPIIAYAWDVAGTNAFLAGASTRSTVFSTSGNHVVHLSVSAADGRSSVATAMIPVLPATYALMRPFPIVRIASSDTRSGIRLRLLRVQAPSGSRISVTCRNRGCPVKSQQKVAAAAATGVAGYTFRKFQRALRAGVVLEIRVSAANQIGKYTRLTIRKGRLPQRVDLCLSPGGAKTMTCPS